MIKIAVCGAACRMGQRLINSVQEAEGVCISGVLERPAHPLVGQDVGLVAGCGGGSTDSGTDATQTESAHA